MKDEAGLMVARVIAVEPTSPGDEVFAVGRKGQRKYASLDHFE
ncbi:MAG TPA: hypothetical protein VMV69_02085 [Pirellulales bacterium]|nr:hypothetical protein [Pirellulales bacterium]